MKHRWETEKTFPYRCFICVYLWLKLPPRLRNVTRNLLLEFVERTELFFVAQFVAEKNFQLRSIKIAGEIEQVNLDPEFRLRRTHGRADADVGHAGKNISARRSMHRIDAVRRNGEAGGIEVRRRKAERASALIAARD